MLTVWLFQVVLIDDYYFAFRTKQMERMAEEMATNLEGYDFSEPIDESLFLELQFRRMAFEQWLVIFDVEGNVYYDSMRSMIKTEASTKIEENVSHLYGKFREQRLAELVEEVSLVPGEPFTYVGNKDSNNTNKQGTPNKPINIQIGMPFKTAQGIEAFIYIQSPVEPIQQTANMLRKQFNVIGAVVCAVAVLLALVFSRYLSKPILKITEFAKQVAKGDYEARVDYQSKDEVGELATTLNNMAYQLGQTEKFRQEFISNTTHDLKTPISAIRADAEVLLDVGGSPEQQEEFLKSIIDESLRLNEMVEQMLKLSEMESGYQLVTPSIFDISEMLEDVVEKYRLLIERKSLKLIIDCETNCMIYADEEMMYRVFDNILSNSIKYTQKGGVDVLAFNKNGIIRIEIADTGKGIAKEALPYVWDRFYREDKARGNSGSSNGLGLAIVKQTLEMHAFHYGIDSKAGMGTTVWIECPGYEMKNHEKN